MKFNKNIIAIIFLFFVSVPCISFSEGISDSALKAAKSILKCNFLHWTLCGMIAKKNVKTGSSFKAPAILLPLIKYFMYVKGENQSSRIFSFIDPMSENALAFTFGKALVDLEEGDGFKKVVKENGIIMGTQFAFGYLAGGEYLCGPGNDFLISAEPISGFKFLTDFSTKNHPSLRRLLFGLVPSALGTSFGYVLSKLN